MPRRLAFFFAALAVSFVARPQLLWAQAFALHGTSSVNRSMAGAAVAAPLDASGALHWNPATISGLQENEIEFDFQLLFSDTELGSSVPAGAAGGGLPPIDLAGRDGGETGVSAIPAFGLVHRDKGSPLTWGLGLYAIAGFRSNYPASGTNPILTPQPPAGLGLGRVFAEAEVFQMAPTVSYAVTDRLSVGFAPTVTMARVAADPLFLVAPNANGYPSGRGNRWTWGGGFQAGVYYIADNGFRFGASYKSEQWFEDLRFHTEDANGLPRVAKVDIEYPMIISVGASYAGWERALLAVDVRYFDYKNADAFGGQGFAADGSANGLGWSSIMSVHTGFQYRVNQCLYLRMGYSYNQNPIQMDDTVYNVASPLITQHLAALGGSYEIRNNLILSLAYLHAFEADQQGPYHTPQGTLPGAQVVSQVVADAVSMSFTVRY